MSDALPRLLLLSPPLTDDGAAAGLKSALQAIAGIDVAALLLRVGDLPDRDLAPRLSPLVALAQARDIAVLLEDRPALLAETGADGLHLNLAENRKSPVKELRRRLGDDVILGAGCGNSRHLAMTAGEQGADYIAFGAFEGGPAAEPELVAWWEAVMTPPQVACGAMDLVQAQDLAVAGADFLALAPGFWLAGGDPAAALTGLLAALAEPA